MSRRSDPMRTVLLAALVAAGEAQAAPTQLRCGTPEPTPAAITRCQLTIERYQQRHGFRQEGGEIGVAFHVLTCGGQGDVSATEIEAQIAELNRAYQGSGFRFRLERVDRADNCRWFHMTPGSDEERSAKHALAIDPARHLNFYVAELPSYLLGWAHLPDHFPEDHFMHGIVVGRGALPGGAIDGFDQGRSAVHEVGHYLGLYHTFQNGCEPPGDVVDDTPYQREPSFGCPPGRNTCPEPGVDPVENYMNYADDRCMTSFTAGQGERMRDMVPAYRPHLIAALLASGAVSSEPPSLVRADGRGTDATRRVTPESRSVVGSSSSMSARGLGFEGAAPNPFCEQTMLRFTLPEPSDVRLRLRSGTGKRVRTLVSRRLAAGPHEVRLEGNGLKPGIYMAELAACGIRETRLVLLER